MRLYEKPDMAVTYYDTADNTNLTLNTSAAIGTYNKSTGLISEESFKLHK